MLRAIAIIVDRSLKNIRRSVSRPCRTIRTIYVPKGFQIAWSINYNANYMYVWFITKDVYLLDEYIFHMNIIRSV